MKKIRRQGWEQFINNKLEILEAYESSKRKTINRPIKIQHGKVAESEFRKWLSSFLPKKYGVTSGYVVSSRNKNTEKLYHYDIIIYNKNESPVLWIDNTPDDSKQGSSLAIPAEYIHGIIEVKSSFNKKNLEDSIKHLSKLKALMDVISDEKTRSPSTFPKNFFCNIVFFEMKKKDSLNYNAFNNIVETVLNLRNYIGFIILKGEELNINDTARFRLLNGKDKIIEPEGSFLEQNTIRVSEKIDNETYLGYFIDWTDFNFSLYAFEIIQLMNGNKSNKYGNFHAT